MGQRSATRAQQSFVGVLERRRALALSPLPKPVALGSWFFIKLTGPWSGGPLVQFILDRAQSDRPRPTTAGKKWLPSRSRLLSQQRFQRALPVRTRTPESLARSDARPDSQTAVRRAES